MSNLATINAGNWLYEFAAVLGIARIRYGIEQVVTIVFYCDLIINSYE